MTRRERFAKRHLTCDNGGISDPREAGTSGGLADWIGVDRMSVPLPTPTPRQAAP